MSSHAPPRSPVIALLGNPNTGKTTLFNALAGLNQRVGNYPGVTVETKKGHLHHAGRTLDLIDLPGTYSLAPRSPDEMVAVDLILGQQAGEPRPDAVLSIVDAANLERNLYLTTQALELGVPVVVALNMVDVAEAQGLRLDAERLSKQLGVHVVPIQANRKKGLERLKDVLVEVATGARGDVCGQPSFPEPFEREVSHLHEHIGGHVAPFLVRRLLLDVGGYTETRLAATHHDLADDVRQARERLAAAGCGVPAVEARARYGWIRQATSGCVERPSKRPVTWTDRIDRVLTHPVWGTLIFLVLMFVVFQSIFTGAGPLMDLIGEGKDALADAVRNAMPAGPLTSLVADGVIEGVGSVVVFLPQILILFAFLAILEDCGYMARAAFLMDRLMVRCGLSGKSFIPMLSSVACAVPGIMATRVLENRRDRLTTILVAPLMSCSARLPVYTLLIGTFLTAGFPVWLPGLTTFGLYALGLILAPIVALLLRRTLLRGETPVFVMEMPLYKWPSLWTVVHRVKESAWAFLRRAGTLILATMVVVWALLYFPRTRSEPETVTLTHPDSGAVETHQVATYDLHVALLGQHRDRLMAKAEEAEGEERERLTQEAEEWTTRIHELNGAWKRQSYLGQAGQAIEPVVRPLGWDWKIGMAALASFPAREVVVGTLGIIYNVGRDEADAAIESDAAGETSLGRALAEARWDSEPERKVFTIPTALSLMVFFALCCQCVSTLAVIRRETNSWRWPVFTFAYMTALAYVGAMMTYQIGKLFL